LASKIQGGRELPPLPLRIEAKRKTSSLEGGEKKRKKDRKRERIGEGSR